MAADISTTSGSKVMVWVGRVISVLPVPLLLMSAGMKIAKSPQAVEGLAKFGYDESVLVGLGVVELICTILYLIPQTAVLGAILLTGYLGGATATHLRVGDNFVAPVLFGVVLWIGLYLRDARVRALAPLRSLPK
jgi:hypothetical protein